MFTINHYHHLDAETAEHLRRMQRQLDHLLKEVINMALDTSKLLASVEKEKTESASMRALVAANTQALGDIKGQLADAIAKLNQQGADTQDLVKVQADIDKAQTDLDADNAATQAALDANTPADTSGSGSQSGASGTGSSSNPNPPPTTPPPSQDQAQQAPQGDQSGTATPLAGTGTQS